LFVLSMFRAVRCGKPCRRLNSLKAFSPTATGASSLMGRGTAHESGFTLLELLTVIALLGIMAGIAVISYDGVQERALCEATRFEMAELRKALLQFRRDTGEFPCRVYRPGDYAPDKMKMVHLDFDGLPVSPALEDYHDWCQNEKPNQVDDGLAMLHRFPYDDTDTDYTGLLWNPDTKRGWNGPYIATEGLTDAWDNLYVLLDPELDFKANYRCKMNGDVYDCLSTDSDDWDSSYELPANVARIVSFGPNKIYDGDGANPCESPDGSDDIVLYLLR
jgi:prepilin-type N-terminal cleavage/methylation domain-containing protein